MKKTQCGKCICWEETGTQEVKPGRANVKVGNCHFWPPTQGGIAGLAMQTITTADNYCFQGEEGQPSSLLNG